MLATKQQRCYFSELTGDGRYDLNTVSSTFYYYSAVDKHITFLTTSGNQFILPLDVDVKSIRALTEGVLIGWGKDREYSYGVLTGHPMGHISPLGLVSRTTDSDSNKWMDSTDQIVYTNRHVPIIVSYNSYFQRHSVYLLWKNQPQPNQTFLQQQYFPSQVTNLGYSSVSITHLYKVVAELFYEESTKENVIQKCKIIKGPTESEFILCMLYSQGESAASYLKLLSCNYPQYINKQKVSNAYMYNAMKIVHVVPNVTAITGFSLFKQQQQNHIISLLKEKQKLTGNTENSAYDLIKICSKKLRESLVIYHSSQKFSLYFGGKVVLNQYCFTQSVCGHESQIKQLRKGQLLMQVEDKIYGVRCFSQISDQLLIAALRSISLLIDPQQYCQLLRDVICNCLVPDYHSINQTLSDDNIQVDELTQQAQPCESDQFKKFTYYVIFMLKLCGGNRSQQVDDVPQKKVKTASSNQFTEQPRSKAFSSMMALAPKDPEIAQQAEPNTQSQGRSCPKYLLSKFMTLTTFSLIQERIFYALHLLLQDQEVGGKVDQRLLYLLYCFALNMDSDQSINYVDYYLRKNPSLRTMFNEDQIIPLIPALRPSTQLSPSSSKAEDILSKIPIDLYQWVFNMYSSNVSVFPILFKKTKQLCRVLEQLLLGSRNIHTWQIPKFVDDFQPFLNNMQKMQLFASSLKRKKTIDSNYDNDTLAFMTIIKKGWDLAAISNLPFYVRVPIMEMLSRLRRNPEQVTSLMGKTACHLLNRIDCYKNWKLYGPRPQHKKRFKTYVDQTIRGQQGSGGDELEDTSSGIQLTYADESTISEVLRIFEFQRDLVIKPRLTEHIPDDKLEQEGQTVLQKLLNRRVSVFVGLGALQYGNSEHFITEQVRFPGINTAGIVAHNGLKIQFDQTREDLTHYQQWPEFHLGVSLALQLSRKLKGLSHESLRTWIFYQKPSQPSNVCGGFMYGLGLLGYLDALNQIDIYHLLTMNLNQQMSHECTQVGVLLGIGASRLGRCDESTQKSLSVHIPSLIPSVLDLELPPNVPTSALCALGLLFLGSGNRNFSEVALGLIGRKPMSDKVVDREGYSLAAGVTLGLINLGKGSVWRREMQVEERLIRFVQGGIVLPPPQSTLSTTFTQTEGNISSIKEGNMVNIHVTCPGALMALAMIFLQSNNKAVVHQLTIPENFSDLESCNPNHMLLKAFTRNLIMWDSIPATQAEIYHQIPELIRFLFEQPLKRINQKYYLVYNTEVIDFMSVAQIYTSVIAGCCLALGVKYAGTHDRAIKALILDELDVLLKLKIAQNELANDPENKNNLEQYTYYTNVVNAIVALSLVMAGSFDNDVMQICKRIRRRLEQSQIWHFGFHQAISMAIGLIHLGRGAYSFSNSQQSVALLILAVYPYYPSQPSDNKQYLQALRWSFVMSVTPKVPFHLSPEQIFKTVDAETNQIVSVKSQVQTRNVENHNPNRQINSVTVADPNYFPFHLTFHDETKSIQVVYVQRHQLQAGLQQLTKSIPLYIKRLHDDSQTVSVMNELDILLTNSRQWQHIKQVLSQIPAFKSLYLQWFLELLRDDQLWFIPILASLIQMKNQKHLVALEVYYHHMSQNSVLQVQQIQHLRRNHEEQIDHLELYLNEKPLPDQESFYRQLGRSTIPSLAELRMIKKFARSLPPQDPQRKYQIVQFYLMKTYNDAGLAELILPNLLQA